MGEEYKVFTESEFNKRVKLFWDIMIKSEFPNHRCPEIQHDRAKRKTRNLGTAHYNPLKLSFSFRMLDGRFYLKDVDDVIKHEIGHLLAYFRYGKRQGHNEKFKKIAKEFGFNGGCSQNMDYTEQFKNTEKTITKRSDGIMTNFELGSMNKGDKIKLTNGEVCEFVRLKRTKFIGIINGSSYDIPVTMAVECIGKAEKKDKKTVNIKDLNKGDWFYIDKGGRAILYKFVGIENGRVTGENPIDGGKARIDSTFDFYRFQQ